MESLLECLADKIQECVYALCGTGAVSDPFRGLNVTTRLDNTAEPAQHNAVRPVDIVQSTSYPVTRIHGAFWCSMHISEHSRNAEDQVLLKDYRMSISYHLLLHILIYG